MFKVVHTTLLSLIYPQSCRICNSSVEDADLGVACRECWSKTRLFSGNEILCTKCGAFLQVAQVSLDAFCRQCEGHFYDSASAVGAYENALAASVIHLKQTPHVAKHLRKLFAAEVYEKASFLDATLIVPVPLSKKRLLERGFNQAGVLATIIAKESGIAVDENSLARKVHTLMHRVAMDRKARDLTVRNAFEVLRPKLIAGRNILLVDDVLTTGSTVSYCAKVLKKSGANKVYVLTLARAV